MTDHWRTLPQFTQLIIKRHKNNTDPVLNWLCRRLLALIYSRIFAIQVQIARNSSTPASEHLVVSSTPPLLSSTPKGSLQTLYHDYDIMMSSWSACQTNVLASAQESISSNWGKSIPKVNFTDTTVSFNLGTTALDAAASAKWIIQAWYDFENPGQSRQFTFTI